MKRVRVIPILLIQDNGLVKTINFKKPNYIGDPINAVKIFNDKEVDEIAILDISATPQSKSPNVEKIREIASEAFMPFAYGGGIKNIEQIREIFNCGVEKVTINTSAFTNLALLEEAAKIYGNQSIVVSMDVRKNIWGKYKVYVAGGKTQTPFEPAEFAKQVYNRGAGEIVLTSIDHEGTFKGYNLDLIHEVSKNISIPVVANGGASCIDDFYKAIMAGASAVAAGSMFVYHGARQGILINYPSQTMLAEQLFSRL